MRFEEVLPMLREGNRIRKKDWPEDMHLYLIRDTIRIMQGNLDFEWKPTNEDIIEEDWLPTV